MWTKIASLLLVMLHAHFVSAFNEWSSWSRCSSTCSGERRRECIKSNRPGLIKDTCEILGILYTEKCRIENCMNEAATKKTTQIRTTSPTIHTHIGKNNCQCGCSLSQSEGRIQAELPLEAVCSWDIKAKPGHLIFVTIESLRNLDWDKGGVYLASPGKVIASLKGLEGKSDYQKKYKKTFKSTKNHMNLTIVSHDYQKKFERISLEFSYITFPDPQLKNTNVVLAKTKNNDEETSSGGGINIPLIASVAACIVAITIASAVFLCRRNRRPSELANNDKEDEDAGLFEDRKDRRLASPRRDRTAVQSKVLLDGHGGAAIELNGRPRDTATGYMSGGDLFVPSQHPALITAIPQAAYVAGHHYINLPLQAFSQTQLTTAYPYQQSYEQITPRNDSLPHVYYKSGGEG